MIVATDLYLTLDGRVILDHVSFSVANGESVALVGPNGSGKTSVLRCLLGLVPFEGHVVIGGHDAVQAPIAARSLMSYVPQKAAFGDVPAREVLVEDPKVFTKPWKMSMTVMRHTEPGFRIVEDECLQDANGDLYHTAVPRK